MADHDTHPSKIDRLLEKLYSPSGLERQLAKGRIIELGAEAVAPLIAFLRDLAASNSIPRFKAGQEQQGQAAVEEYCSLVQREGYESPNVDAAMHRVFNLTINDRLSRDAIFILGEIKSEEAILFLIKIMEANPFNFFGVSEKATGFDCLLDSEEIKALLAIGLVAVPYLINEIRDIDRKARTHSIEELDLHFCLGCDLPEGPPVEEDSSEEEGPTPEDIQRYIRDLQVRILMMFCRMKDPRTLPYLEELLKETTDERLISEIKRAIAHIKGEVDIYTRHFYFRVLAK